MPHFPGMPAEQAAEMAHGTPMLEFTVTDTQLVVRTIGDESYNNNTFIFGQECESNFAGLKFLVWNFEKQTENLINGLYLHIFDLCVF